MTPLSRALRQHRRTAGLTQKDLAARMGYHPSRLSRLESGAELPGEEFIERFIRTLGLADTPAAVLRALRNAKPLSDAGDEDEFPLVTMHLPPAWVHPTPPEPPPTLDYYPLLQHENVIARLLEWLRDPAGRPVISLEGAGGLGKTTLALEAARRLEEAHAFRVLLVSAGYARSTVSATAPARRLTYELTLDRLARQMDLADAVKGSLLEKEELLGAFFHHEPYLIVLDNLEDSENEVEIVHRVRALCHPTRVLVTTRTRTLHAPDFVRPLHLHGLNAADSTVYLRAEGERLEMPEFLALDRAHFAEIHTLTVGVPYALKRVVGQLHTWSLETALDNLRRAAQPGDQEFYNSLFAQDWGKLDEPARRFWLLLGRMVPTTISLAQLRALDHANGDFERALERLVASNLVETGPGLTDRTKRYSVHPLARLFLEHLPKLTVLDHAQAEYYRVGCVRAATRLWLEVGMREPDVIRFDAERENVMHAVSEAYAAGLYAQVLELWERFSAGLYDMGYWNEYHQLDTLTLAAARALGNQPVQAAVQGELGWVAIERGEMQEAETRVQAALELFTALGDPIWSLIMRRYLATIHMVGNELDRARLEFSALLADIETTLQNHPEWSSEQLVRQSAVIHNGLGSVLREQGDLAGAERELRLAMEEARARNPATLAIALLNLGKLKIKADLPDEARAFLEECLALCREHNLPSIAAGALYQLAQVALRREDRTAALELAHDAQAVYQRLGAAASERMVAQFIRSLE